MGKSQYKIGIDLTGGDAPPETLFKEIFSFSDSLDESTHLVFFAPLTFIEKFEKISSSLNYRFELSFVQTQDPILMSDHPLLSIRRKKGTPLHLALKQLKNGEIDAFVSTANTGALVTAATLILKTIKGIKRPGLLAIIPTLKKPLAVIDVGANIHSTAQHLFQFAKIGIAYQKAHKIIKPVVGLLNIGIEKEKGRRELREAYNKLLQLNKHQESLTFIGNIEAKHVFKGDVDVLVTEGFAGNIFLKTAEGVSHFIFEKAIDQEIEGKKLSIPSNLKDLLSYKEHPGAIVCGVQGIVVKTHGDACGKTIFSAIKGALELAHGQFLTRLKRQLKV